MAVYHVLFVSLALSVVVLAAPSANKQKQYEAKVMEHLNRVDKFRCNKPQPRLVSVADLLNNTMETDVSYLPAATVLHLCDAASGCCFNDLGRTCGPKNFTDVELVFLVRGDVPSYNRGSSYVTVTARNHTACACREISVAERPK